MNAPMSVDALRAELVRRQLLSPSAGKMPAVSHDRPWFISIVLGAAGWLAGVFALAFVALLLKPDTAGGIALAGVMLLLGAFFLYAVDRDSQFLDQFALALSIAGQFAVVWAADRATNSNTATAAWACILQVAVLIVMPNRLAKVLAAFFACCAWALLVRFGWWEAQDFNDQRQLMLGSALMGWFAVWVPIIIAVQILVSTESAWMSSALRSIARAALTGMLLSLSVATWISEPLGSLVFWEGQHQKDWMALWPLLGAISSLLAAVYAFRLGNWAFIGVASIGALLHVSQFYYLLGLSLLLKSCIMLGVGVIALIAATWLQRRGTEQEAAT
ncbi:MAG TPA: DUF4401 domain-containing protein [Steroidobacter sp.]